MSLEINFLNCNKAKIQLKVFDENKIYVIRLVPETIECKMRGDDAACLVYVSFVVMTPRDLLGIERLLLE